MNLQGYNYYVVGGNDTLTCAMMDNACASQTGLRDANIVVFTGGVDVSPALYGEKAHEKTQKPDRVRDKVEAAIYHLCYKRKKFMVGICRGAQFLNVMNGGRLWQHVDRHNQHHPVMYMNEKSEKYLVACTSDHHQMMIPTADGRIWGWCGQSTIKEADTRFKQMPEKHNDDPEIVFYRATRSLCFQPHPEWGLVSCRSLFFDVLRRAMRA